MTIVKSTFYFSAKTMTIDCINLWFIYLLRSQLLNEVSLHSIAHIKIYVRTIHKHLSNNTPKLVNMIEELIWCNG